jgi:hypothetical protein
MKPDATLMETTATATDANGQPGSVWREGNERRRDPRRPLDLEVFCYVDGARLDGWTADVSAGGLFLKTDVQQDIPQGVSVGLAFKAQDPGAAPVILFGRVVRRQDRDTRGVGIQWERAVTPGPPAELAKVLADVLGLEARDIRPCDDGSGRSAYDFRAGRTRIAAGTQDFSGLPEAADWPRTPGPGAVSRQVERRLGGVDVEVDAWAGPARGGAKATIRRLGTTALTLRRVDGKLFPDGEIVEVRFEIRTTGGRAQVTLRCRPFEFDVAPEGEDDGTTSLEIVERHEGANPGLFDRYVKWLHLQSMYGT